MKRYEVRSYGMGEDPIHGEWVRHADAEAEVESWKILAHSSNERADSLLAQVTSQAEELRENEGVIAVWRGRTNRAEAEVEKWRRVAVFAYRRSGEEMLRHHGTYVSALCPSDLILAALAKAAGEE